MTEPPNDNGPTLEGRAADESARAGELVPDQDSKFSALCEAMRDTRLSFADVRVYCALLSQPLYEREGITACRPSRPRIANGAGLHLQTIPRSLRVLAELGYIEVTLGSGRSTNRYALLRLRRGSEAATGNGAATGSQTPWADVTVRLPLRDARGSGAATSTARRGSEAATQYLEQPHSVPLSRAASVPAADSGHHKEQGSDKTLKASAGRRKNTRQQPAAEKACEPAGPAAGLWTEGVAYLMTAASLKESTARGFLGRFVKEAGSNETAVRLIAEAKRLQVASPQAWLIAAAKNNASKGKATHVDMTEAEQIAFMQAQAKRFQQ